MAVSAQKREFHVIIERGEDGYYIGSVVELPGCHTQARTMKELDRRLKEVIELYVDSEEVDFTQFITVKKVKIRAVQRESRSLIILQRQEKS